MVLESAIKTQRPVLNAIGRHLLIEMRGCKNLNDKEVIKNMLKDAVEACNATLIEVEVHEFSPYGVSGIAIIGESHLSIHTWPEYGYAAIDIFTCGTRVNPYDALPPFKDVLQPKEVSVLEIKRGILTDDSDTGSCSVGVSEVK
ncbi:MAG TPA: adenosylmethionine decarboxylase [Thermoplasmatales archaeon]|nr:adenosylmethionine decarboxylase [Thermoplasmatales archaeon]